MITEKLLTTKLLLASLASTVCPCCGEMKGRRKSTCYRCYKKLPKAMQTAMYDRVGCGYEEAMLNAMNKLGCVRFFAPDGTFKWASADGSAGSAP